MDFVTRDGIRIHYETSGEGTALVLVPGLASGAWMWWKQTGPLSARFRTIGYDPRGVGRSDKPEAPASMRRLADDVAELLDALGLERAHVCGASFGGFVAQEFAIAHPERLDALVLCCTSAGGASHVPPSLETVKALTSAEGLNGEARARRLLAMGLAPGYVEAHAGEFDETVALRLACHIPSYAYLNQVQAAMAFSSEARLGRVGARTLVITGDRDEIVSPRNSELLAARIPDARLVVLEGGAHSIFMDSAERFNAAVAAFLEDTAGAPRAAG